MLAFNTFVKNMVISDKIQLLKRITFRKAFNLWRLYFSFMISRLFKKGRIFGNPFSLSIEPTTACNLGCPECPSGLKSFTRVTGNLKPELNKKIIDELYRDLFYINYYFQGEPYINPNFLDFIKYATAKGIYCSTSTNAHFLTSEKSKQTIESGLNRMIISIDGTTQETYEQYRKNGSLEKVLEGTRNIINWKNKLKSNTPHIIFQFLVVKHNEHQINDAIKLSKEMGVNEIRFKTAQLYNYQNGNPLIPSNNKYSRYKQKKDGSYVLKNKFYNHCWRMWSSAVITVDGKLVPCCFDKDASHLLGNIEDQSIREIWKGKDYHEFRKNVLTQREKINICKNCSEGSKVWT